MAKPPNPTVQKRTLATQQAFLAVLATGKSINASAVAAGIDRTTAFRWRASDPDFAEAWDSAIEAGTDALEDVALERANKTSDLLAIFLLKARRPDKYRERSTTKVEVENTHKFDLTNLDERTIDQLRDILQMADAPLTIEHKG